LSGTAIDLRAPLPADLTLSLKTVDGSGTLADTPDLLEHFGFFRDDG
jgi:hypothetical protein